MFPCLSVSVCVYIYIYIYIQIFIKYPESSVNSSRSCYIVCDTYRIIENFCYF